MNVTACAVLVRCLDLEPNADSLYSLILPLQRHTYARAGSALPSLVSGQAAI